MLILAVACWWSVAVLTVAVAHLLTPLPFQDSNRLVRVWEVNRRYPTQDRTVSEATFMEWKRRAQSFDALAAHGRPRPSLISDGRRAEVVRTTSATEDFFRLLHVSQAAGASRGLAISQSLAETLCGDGVSCVNKALWAEGVVEWRVDRVMPAGFEYPDGTEMWTIWKIDNQIAADDRGSRFLSVVGRLKPGVSPAAAEAELNAIASTLARDWPDSHRDWQVQLMDLGVVDTEPVRRPLALLSAAVLLLLLLACANIGTLQLAGGAARQGEIALKRALGARPSHLVAGTVAEAAAIALLGAAVGTLGAALYVRMALPQILGALPRGATVIPTTWHTAPIAFAVLCGSTLLCAVIGMFRSLRHDVNEDIRLLQRSSGRRTSRLIEGGIVVQVALATVLVALVVLTSREFMREVLVDSVMDDESTVAADMRLPIGIPGQVSAGYPLQRFGATAHDVLTRLAAIPGVSAVGLSTALPMDLRPPVVSCRRARADEVQRQSEAPHSSDEGLMSVSRIHTSAGYFQTLGLKVLEGTAFSDMSVPVDPTALPLKAPSTVMVSRALARAMWPDGPAVGKRLVCKDQVSPQRLVVAVVQDVSLDLTGRPAAIAYVPYFEAPESRTTVVVRGQTESLQTSILSTIARLDVPNAVVHNIRTVASVVAAARRGSRSAAVVMGILGFAAAVIAALGIFAIVRLSVEHRRREIAIRVALGLTPGGAVRSLMRRALWLTAAGALLGVGLGLGPGAQLFGSAADAGWSGDVVLGGALGTLGIGALAAWLAARRIARIPLNDALASE